MRRLVSSRTFAVVLLTAVLAGMVGSLYGLGAGGRQWVAHRAQSIAEVIVAATVGPHLDGSAAAGTGPSAVDLTELRRDVHALRHAGRLAGIGIWRRDGAPLFADPPSSAASMRVTATDLIRAGAGTSWTTAGGRFRGGPTVRVFLPVHQERSAGAADTWLIGVDVPQDTAEGDVAGQQLRQVAPVVVSVALLIVGLLWQRRELPRGARRTCTDALTGLPNRDVLIEAAVALPAATPERPAALMLLDLAEFKAVNESLGHLAGDELLRQVASALRGYVGDGDLVARLRGDEFAVLLTGLPDATSAQLRAEQLLDRLRSAPFRVDDVELAVDASIGVVLVPQHGRDVIELLRRADIAVSHATRGHKGTLLYDEGFDRHSVDRLQLVAELRRALDRGEFVLHYQPKLTLPDRRVHGVEALVRWQHPTRGLLLPGEFLPLLEQTGLIQPVTRWVLRQAARQAAQWRRSGMPLTVAVNISTRSLLSPALPATVLSIVTGADLPPSFLELEITESVVTSNPERAAKVLGQLRARGVEVSIDDFGAGYTSLALLRALPVTALKIDRSLVSRMLDHACDRVITEAVIDLGHRLGLRVIAEGVESHPLLDELITLGCDSAQGFLISPGLAADALERLLISQDLAVTTAPVQPGPVVLTAPTD
jgi:diguanylate cyclase (GGDEF)-like protein